MKVLWVSNAPFVGSGYGVQAGLFTRLIKAAGHEVIAFAPYGHHGPTLTMRGVQVLPASRDAYGNDILTEHIEHYQPDVTVLLADIWVYDAEALGAVTAWAPIDHDPMPPAVNESLHWAHNAWAMSHFGERQMRKAGIVPEYVPHGVDTAAYYPLDRAEARRECEIEPGRFVAMMVAANLGHPSRKSLDRVLKAWGQFVKTEPDALLYLHTLPDGGGSGIDLINCARFYDVPDRNLRFPDPYHFVKNDYTPLRMNALYNVADVLLAPSMGEGFGVPVIEAQAAGCPVIVTDFSAQSELAGPGYKIPVSDDDRVYTLQGSEQAMVRPSEIVKGLGWAVEHVGDADVRAKAREFAMQYDAQHVFDAYMLPSLERICAEKRERSALRAARTAARLALRNPPEVQKVLQEELVNA